MIGFLFCDPLCRVCSWCFSVLFSLQCLFAGVIHGCPIIFSVVVLFFSGADKVLDFMGEGTFARVLECWDRKEKRHVAIKVVRAVEKYTESAAIEKQIILKVMEAADRLLDRKEFTHCIQLIDDFMFRGHFCLVYPKCGRSLYDFLRRNRYRGFSSECLFHLSRQLVEAIACL